MPRRFHAATLIVSRTYLFPGMLRQEQVRPWFGRLVGTVRKEADANQNEEDNHDDENLPPVEFFIDSLGSVYGYPPGRQLIAATYPNSGILDEPVYIPANWRIVPQIEAKGTCFTAKLRIRLHQHGICTPALYCQITQQQGWTAEELVQLLRGLVDLKPRKPTLFKVTTATGAFDGTASDILKRALSAVATGIFVAKYTQTALKESVKLEPDHLLLDLGKTSPQLKLPKNDEELAQLLALSTDPDRQLTHTRQAELGRYKTDWIGANSKHLLFCDTRHPWPARRRPRGYRRSQGARRSLLRRGRVAWHMSRVVDLVRAHKLWAQQLTNLFQKSNLEMTRAKNQDINFLKTMLKATYYDDRLFTLALDLPAVRPKLFGTGKKLFAYLAHIMGLDEAETRLGTEMKKFESRVNSWQPGITRLVDLFKLAK